MSLPLKAKVAIRDSWEQPTSLVQESMKSLFDSIGYRVTCEPQWNLLLTELESDSEDQGQLVNFVASCVSGWLDCMKRLTDDADNEAWSEKIVDEISSVGSGKLTIFLEVSATGRSSTWWSDSRGGFVISLPKAESHNGHHLVPAYGEQLLSCFGDKKASSPNPGTSPSKEPLDESVKDSSKPSVVATGGVAVAPKTEYLPNSQGLPKPETLLSKPPYHMIIHSRSANRIEVQCSHSPTLEVLADYLKKWCRTNTNLTNKPPAIDIKLHQSTFGLDLMYDTLTLAAENRYSGIFTVSPAIILNLVEGVLGYERLFGNTASWHYRKETAFKKF